MTRKLFLLAAALVVTIWASSADALGPCTCTFCFQGSTAHCTFEGDIMSCKDFRMAFC
jgi:hypothetical protein